MTHLRIELNGITEEVSSSVISKLYEIINSGVDASSNLQGRLHCPISYRAYVNYLTTEYPDLYITVDDYAIPFEDPNMVTYLNSIGIGSNGMITEALAAAATSIYSSTANTTVTKFNEFRYFTNITTSSSGGWNGQGTNYYGFRDWTALEEIDISNLTMIGHSHTGSTYPVFWGCTSLKTVIASSSLEKIGASAFRDCSNLETISGLSGEIELAARSFQDCSKLESSNFTNVLFLLGTNDNEGMDFSGCSALTTIHVSSNTSTIPLSCFEGCTNLSSITGLSSVTQLKGLAFKNCSSLTTITGLSNVTTMTSSEIFARCSSLTSVDINWSNIVGHTIPHFCFGYCTSLRQLDITGATQIDKEAFRSCSNLTTLTGLSNITLSDQGSQFYDCLNLIFPNNFRISSTGTSVGTYTFYNCKGLTSIEFDSLITSIKNNAFYGCINLSSLGTTTFNNITELLLACFYNCSSLTGELNFPNLTTFPAADNGRGALFYGCTGLTKISLGHVTNLYSGPASSTARCIFYNCTSLVTVDLGDSLEKINYHNFNGCAALRNVIIRTLTPPITNNPDSLLRAMFGNDNVNIYVPDSVVNDYKASQYWSNYASHICPLFTNKTFTLGEYLNSTFSSAMIEGNNIEISRNCFKDNTNLVSIVGEISGFYYGSFNGCTSLTTLDLSQVNWASNPTKDVMENGSPYNNDDSPFYNCLNLTSIGINTIPGITTLGTRAIWYTGLSGVFTFPNVLTLNMYSIGYCDNITKVSFPNLLSYKRGNMYNDGEGCIKECNSLKVIDLGSHLLTISQRGFSPLSALEAVLINVSTPPTVVPADDVASLATNDAFNSKQNLFGNSTCKIYVPDADVTTYLNTYPYTLFSSDILPMSQYDEDTVLNN